MNVTRFQDAKPYEAPNHFDMRCLRLQGKEASPTTQMWMGMSQILPGGRTSLDASPNEKLYFVAEGEVTFVGEMKGLQTREVLRAYDTVRFMPGEARQLLNETNRPALVVLVMANQPG